MGDEVIADCRIALRSPILQIGNRQLAIGNLVLCPSLARYLDPRRPKIFGRSKRSWPKEAIAARVLQLDFKLQSGY
jgi:hypothetical protein